MAASPSPAFKPWSAFLKRAEELEKESAATGDADLAVVAFHCRKYVVEKAVKTLEKPAADPFFMTLFSELEIKKKGMVGMTPEQRRELCTVHAQSVFAKAVKQKEAEEASTGRASKNTAAIFYKAGTLLDILDQFDLPPDEAVVVFCRFHKDLDAVARVATETGRRSLERLRAFGRSLDRHAAVRLLMCLKGMNRLSVF